MKNLLLLFAFPVFAVCIFTGAAYDDVLHSPITLATAAEFNSKYEQVSHNSKSYDTNPLFGSSSYKITHTDFVSLAEYNFINNSLSHFLQSSWLQLFSNTSGAASSVEDAIDSLGKTKNPQIVPPPDPAGTGQFPPGVNDPRLQSGGQPPPVMSQPSQFNSPPSFGAAPSDSGQSIPKRAPSDSAARVKFLTYEKKYSPVASAFKERVHALFVEPKGGIQRVVTVDSAKSIVHIRELLNGKDIRVPLDIPLNEYIRLRYEYEKMRRTSDYVGKYENKNADALGNVFKNLTEIEIPVPPNPLMSIFGNRNVVSLRITGAVDITAGFRSEKSDQQTVFINPTQNTPTFKQQVQVNVTGMIGDKLSITADWSTERTFDYENQLKIKYKGYEDEIVQSIEAGNVSLQTPSALVGGSGALFGIKAEFQLGPLRLTALASQKKGEGSRLSINGGSQESKFEKHAYQYDDRHYFVDLRYSGDVYEDIYNYRNRKYNGQLGTMPRVRQELYIKDMEVWVTPPTSLGVVIDPLARDAVALITPGATLPADPYPQSYLDYIDPNKAVLPVAGEIEVGKFKKLTRDVDYIFNEVSGIISLNQNIQDDQVLAVAFRIQNFSPGTDDDSLFGTFVNDQRLNQRQYVDANGKQISPRLVLKLIKPRNLNPSFKTAWQQQVRSIFSIGTRNLKKEDIQSIKLIYRLGGSTEPEELLKIPLLLLFGLDNGNDAGGNDPDTRIDQNFIDAARGLIIFPTLRPWDTGLADFFRLHNIDTSQYKQYLYPDVYDTTVVIARQSDRDKIILTGVTKGTASSTYQLGFNLVRGSVRVYLNGQALVPNVDYRVDEEVGLVTITKEEALVPGAKVDIDYERQDLFSFASKTLLGMRGEVALGKESAFGFSLLNLNQKTLSDKVRIGEEPLNNTMFGVDARTKVDLPFITDALNRLPFISTNEKSYLQIQGEAAVMMPNPNTMTSPMPSDNGASIAYIDDFEGSKLFAPLQTAYSIWKMASVPANHIGYIDTANPTGTIVDSIMQSHRARLNWYNLPLSQSNVNVTQVWPNRKAAIQDQKVNVLELEYHPYDRGMYNYTPNTHDSLTKSWGGVMRLLPINAYNLIDGNYNYIEVWMKIESPRISGKLKGKMLIDIGKLSEDVIPDHKLNSEDLVLPGSIANGILNPGEDVGLDMISNEQEVAKYQAEINQYGGQYPDMQGDPSNDNYNYDPNDWRNFNGTEGNIRDIAGQFPDTEDLNSNSILDLNNDYFQYEVDLDTTLINTPGSYIVGGGFPNASWFQFRIPITDYKRTIGNPTLTDVQYIRVWLTGVEDTVFRVRIADFNLIGNQWIERIKTDSSFKVSVVNIEDNPDYSSPPGVIRPRDRTRPDQEVYGNEQSLSFLVQNLPDGVEREAVRYFPSGIDLFNYKEMKLFVHGSEKLPYISPTNYASDIVLRMGVDTSNYYEYRQPIREGWDALNEVDINFSRLTAIKPLRTADTIITKIDSVRFDTLYVKRSIDVAVGNAAGSYMRVVGSPDLIRVNFISIGVQNPVNDYTPGPISGTVWADELRVTGAKNDVGYAYQGSMNLRIADFADVSATVSYSDPYFHGLTERFKQDRSYTTSWSANTTLNLDKVLPKSWQGTQMRVSYTHAENLRKPLLLPGEPDVEVEATIQQTQQQLKGKTQQEIDYETNKIRVASQTFDVRDSWAIPTVRLKAPGESWLITGVVNRIELSYNYSIVRARDPLLEQRRQWQWTARAAYSLDLPKELYFSPFKSLFRGIPILDDYRDLKLYYAPNRFGLSADMNRTRDERRDRATGVQRPNDRLFEHSRGVNFGYQLSENGLFNFGGTYSSSIHTSLLKLETDPTLPIGQDQRQSSVIFNDIFFGRSGGLYFGDPLSYDQQINLTSRPKIPKLFDLDRYIDLNLSYQVSYHWQTNLQQGSLGRGAAYNAGVNAQMNFKLKSLFDPLFKTSETAQPNVPQRGALPGRRTSKALPGEIPPAEMPPTAQVDTLSNKTGTSDSLKGAPARLSFGKMLGRMAYYLIKIPLLDYENISFSYNQTTTSTVSGVLGLTGFTNFWGSGLLNPFTDAENGPSRFYQLGLIRTPNPSNERLTFKSAFPFITIEGVQSPGLRAVNLGGSYVDNFTQGNTIALKTNRDLWEGVKLDVGWDLKWQMNKNTQVLSQPDGSAIIQSELTTSSIERSYLMFPDFLFFKIFKTNMTSVTEKYQKLQAANPNNSGDNLAQAFEEGFEAVPFLGKFLNGMMPRINWGIRWDGLEKIPFLSKFADRISLEHRYKSTIGTKFRGNNDEPMITESKRVQYDFSPLLGVTLGFSKLWGGDLSVNASWRTQSAYDLNTSSSNIVQQGSTEISMTANYRKTGFDLPIFGVYLKNDIDMSFAFSTNKTDSYTYQVNDLTLGGQPREGQTRITIEPRVRYVISQRVTSSIFFRYQRTKPDAAVGSRIPGTTIYEGGLEIRISITGT